MNSKPIYELARITQVSDQDIEIFKSAWKEIDSKTKFFSVTTDSFEYPTLPRETGNSQREFKPLQFESRKTKSGRLVKGYFNNQDNYFIFQEWRGRTKERYLSEGDWDAEFKHNRYFAKFTDYILHRVLTLEKTDIAEIYDEVKRKYPEICVDYIYAGNEIKWEKEVRAVLATLRDNRQAQSVTRGKWVRLK